MTRLFTIVALSPLLLPGAALGADLPTGRWEGVVRAGTESVAVGLTLESRPGGPSCVATFPTRPNPARCTASVGADGVLSVEVPATSSRFSLKVLDAGAALEGIYVSPTASSQTIRLTRTANDGSWAPDPAPHRQLFVTAPDGVRIEVLDFGGEGSPVILIPGLGAGGHDFDSFAPRLAANHRVYAVTRRGYGASDTPALTPDNYTARKQGDDVIAVMSALGIERAALAGWSMGGAEIGSVASRYPDKVSAAIYLDAAYAYSYFAPGNSIPFGTNARLLTNELDARLGAVLASPPSAQSGAEVEAIRTELLPLLEAELAAAAARLKTQPALAPQPPSAAAAGRQAPDVGALVSRGVERFGTLKVPVLSIFAVGLDGARDEQAAQIARYRAGNPQARIVEIRGGDHAVFVSHAEEVLAAMEDFLGTKPRTPAPGGEAAIRKLTADVLRGEPDYAAMTPAGAQALRNALTAQQTALKNIGEVSAVSLVGAAPDGRERYRLEGPGGAIEYSIARGPGTTVTHAAQRILRRNPFPTGEAALRNLVSGILSGTPDYAGLTPAYATTVRNQQAAMRRDLEALGEVRAITLVRADPNGRDVYRIEGAARTAELGIAMTPDGLISGLGFRSLPAG